MKTKFGFLVVLLLAGTFAVNAQGGGNGAPQRRTVEERVKTVMDKLGDWKMDKDLSGKTETIFTDYYKAQDKMREEAMAGGGTPDRDKMRESMTKMATERDDKLKKVWSEDKFKEFKEKIEPTMRGGGQRPGGGNGGGNGNGGGTGN